MTLVSSLLITAAGLIYLGLGTLHLYFTFVGHRFDPHDAELAERMKHATLRLTRQTTLWKAWIGFNASHSTGAIFFGSVLALIAWTPLGTGAAGLVFWGVSLVHSGFYVWLARTYWFRVPLAGTALATLLLMVAGLLHFVQS